MKKHLRVLVFSPVKFNQQTGSGVTMGNLFKGWPIDDLAQIYSDEKTIPDLSICNKYYHLPYISSRQKNVSKMSFSIANQLFRFTIGKQETFLGHWVNTDKVERWCEEFKPDLLFARPLDRPSFSIWLPLRLSQKLKIPIVNYILDDWPMRQEAGPVNIRKLLWKILLNKQLRVLFQSATINIGISAEMCDVFEQRYKSRFVPFHNCVELSDWENIPKSRTVSDEFTILYLGTVTKDKELYSLIDIRDIVLSLHEKGYPVRLVIYGPNQYRETVEKFLEHIPVITHGGFFEPEQKQRILTQADLLLLPINFDQRSLAYIGYSFQTKVPEYMASGNPTLVYGPLSNPNVSYAKREGWAAVVDQKNKIKLEEMLVQLINDSDLRSRLGTKARQLAFEHHDATKIRKQFYDMLWQATLEYKP
jgi:glycosyltransferase involved in cell wall biosynthesis